MARGEQILGQVLETLEHFFIPFCLVFGKGTMPFSFHVPVVGLNYGHFAEVRVRVRVNKLVLGASVLALFPTLASLVGLFGIPM